jgi:hypothetical protein
MSERIRYHSHCEPIAAPGMIYLLLMIQQVQFSGASTDLPFNAEFFSPQSNGVHSEEVKEVNNSEI